VLVAVGIGIVFRLGVLDPLSPVAAGLGYLAVLQVAAAAFNMIPIPPLDGFGALSAHLPPEAQLRARAMGRLGYFALLAAFWYSAPLNSWY
jgi:Zn-dependent protease